MHKHSEQVVRPLLPCPLFKSTPQTSLLLALSHNLCLLCALPPCSSLPVPPSLSDSLLYTQAKATISTTVAGRLWIFAFFFVCLFGCLMSLSLSWWWWAAMTHWCWKGELPQHWPLLTTILRMLPWRQSPGLPNHNHTIAVMYVSKQSAKQTTV